jgi:hypothetical protein
MENVLHQRVPGQSIFDSRGWHYWSVCGEWVESYQIAHPLVPVTCPLCRADLGLQNVPLPVMWADDLPSSEAPLWVDPP